MVAPEGLGVPRPDEDPRGADRERLVELPGLRRGDCLRRPLPGDRRRHRRARCGDCGRYSPQGRGDAGRDAAGARRQGSEGAAGLSLHREDVEAQLPAHRGVGGRPAVRRLRRPPRHRPALHLAGREPDRDAARQPAAGDPAAGRGGHQGGLRADPRGAARAAAKCRFSKR